MRKATTPSSFLAKNRREKNRNNSLFVASRIANSVCHCRQKRHHFAVTWRKTSEREKNISSVANHRQVSGRCRRRRRRVAKPNVWANDNIIEYIITVRAEWWRQGRQTLKTVRIGKKQKYNETTIPNDQRSTGMWAQLSLSHTRL